MRSHTIIGERIVSAAPALAGVAKIVRSSHERVDGGGYPDGLSGSDIPLGARIVFACDAFHAMVSDRPYAASRTVAEASAELRRCAGSQFDVAVVAAICDVLSSGDGPQLARPAADACRAG
jgi:HD-GYP domain-containing protein (c-di-GMP phosphodiesterase class II)